MKNRLQGTDGEPIDKRLPVMPISASAGSDGGDGKGLEDWDTHNRNAEMRDAIRSPKSLRSST